MTESKSPFDQNPRPLEPATNGFIWCEACKAPRQLPHACDEEWEKVLTVASSVAKRAEFAESLLCAIAFDHGRDIEACQVAQVDPFATISCPNCIFCEAAGR